MGCTERGPLQTLKLWDLVKNSEAEFPMFTSQIYNFLSELSKDNRNFDFFPKNHNYNLEDNSKNDV